MYEHDGVTFYLNLLDLTCYMCNSKHWHDLVREHGHNVTANWDEHKHWLDGLYWLMGVHAREWEKKGWSFEPNHTDVLLWL